MAAMTAMQAEMARMNGNRDNNQPAVPPPMSSLGFAVHPPGSAAGSSSSSNLIFPPFSGSVTPQNSQTSDPSTSTQRFTPGERDALIGAGVMSAVSALPVQQQ